jgi:hypothetical protein
MGLWWTGGSLWSVCEVVFCLDGELMRVSWASCSVWMMAMRVSSQSR